MKGGVDEDEKGTWTSWRDGLPWESSWILWIIVGRQSMRRTCHESYATIDRPCFSAGMPTFVSSSLLITTTFTYLEKDVSFNEGAFALCWWEGIHSDQFTVSFIAVCTGESWISCLHLLPSGLFVTVWLQSGNIGECSIGSPKINSSVLGQCVTKNPEGNSYNRNKHEIYDSRVQTALKDTVNFKCYCFSAGLPSTNHTPKLLYLGGSPYPESLTAAIGVSDTSWSVGIALV